MILFALLFAAVAMALAWVLAASMGSHLIDLLATAFLLLALAHVGLGVAIRVRRFRAIRDAETQAPFNDGA